MTHRIIKTNNYLLVVDDGRNYPIDCKYRYIYVDNVITRITSIQPFQNYIDLIIYHLPLNNALTLEGVPLLPPLEDDESICPYPEEKQKAIEAKIKSIETYHKGLPAIGVQVLNPETGEVETHYPPAKTSTTSVAVTLK